MTRLASLVVAVALLVPASASAWADLDFGCQHPTWAGGQTSWHLMSNYLSNDIPASALSQIIQDSFDEWGNPGCSNITATQTATTGGSVPDGQGSIVFFENNVGWPMDENILAYATPTPGPGCSIASSAIVFNAVTYTWSTGGGGNDLQSVMTHEVGHWLGLDHSSHGGATMAACYSGGTDDQILSCDDTEGICTLYPSGGTSCDERGGDDYCGCGFNCEEGSCVADPAGSNGPGEQASSADGCDEEGSGSDPGAGGAGADDDALGPDSDSDGIPDGTEGAGDTDGDGIPDFVDSDSDGDGISDADEAGPVPGAPVDTDGDGTPDFIDTDSDDDSIPDSEEGPGDTDGDGVPDFLDEDSDDDGIPDEDEAGDDPEDPADTDGDGAPDFVDEDSDGDGIPDAEEGDEDTDGDGAPDFLDEDSDGDGIPDEEEAGDDPENPDDTDGDGDPDYLDEDSDNDGIPDEDENASDDGGDGSAEDGPNGLGGDHFDDWFEDDADAGKFNLGCACNTGGGAPSFAGLLGLIPLVLVARRRRA